MTVWSQYLRPEASREQRQAAIRFNRRSQTYMDQCASDVRHAAKSDWCFAINAAVVRAYLSPADIAEHLGVMRSTVSRWLDGTMAPPDKAKPEFIDKLVNAIKKQAA